MALSLALLKPSSHENWPEEFDGHLECNLYSICCSFNRKGSLLAVGYNDGHIVFWDFLSRVVAKMITAHASHPVCSVDWSRNGRKLVSGSLDNRMKVWDTSTGTNLLQETFVSPICKTQFNPRNDKFVLVTSMKIAPILIEISYPHVDDKGNLVAGTAKRKTLPSESDPETIATFDRRGQHIYTGNTRGKIVIYKCPKFIGDGKDLEIVAFFRISSSPAIRDIEFGAHNKTLFLVNSSDRAIRLYDCRSALAAGLDGSCEEMRRIQDNVAKTTYHKCCISGDPSATYICVAYQNSIQIYETETGSVRKIIPGEKGDQIVDLKLHPLRPIAVSVSSGKVSIWARPQIENWSAFAPEFQELEKNMEYEERESEFDISDEDLEAARRKIKDEKGEVFDDGDVDVESVEPLVELLSSDEEATEDCLDYIPITLDDPEMIEPYQQEIANATPQDPQSIQHTDGRKKRSPIKRGSRQKAEISTKRPRTSDKSNSAKKGPRQT